MIKKSEYFHVQHTLFAMSDKRKYKKSLCRKQNKSLEKPTKPFPNKWKRKLAKSDEGLYYNQGKWNNEHEYEKEWY